MNQFDWFAISGYWAISRDPDLKLRILLSLQNVSRDSRLFTLIKTNTPLIKNKLIPVKSVILFVVGSVHS